MVLLWQLLVAVVTTNVIFIVRDEIIGKVITMFLRAAQRQILTPQERAILKLFWGVVWTGLVAVLGELGSLIVTGGLTFSTPFVVAVAVAFGVACLNAIAKLVSAHGDVLGAAALSGLATSVQDRYGANEAKTGVILPPMPSVLPGPPH